MTSVWSSILDSSAISSATVDVVYLDPTSVGGVQDVRREGRQPGRAVRQTVLNTHHRIPLDENASDAADLVEEAAAYLGQRYGQEFSQTIEMVELMLARHLDEVEVRRETKNSAGLIEWQLGNEAVVSTRDILSAAAKAAASKRKRYFNSESIISDEFLSQCFMGQTKVGSYVVTALTPAEVSLATSRSEKDQARHPRIEGRMIVKRQQEIAGATDEMAVQDRTAPVPEIRGRLESSPSTHPLRTMQEGTMSTQDITVTILTVGTFVAGLTWGWILTEVNPAPPGTQTNAEVPAPSRSHPARRQTLRPHSKLSPTWRALCSPLVTVHL